MSSEHDKLESQGADPEMDDNAWQEPSAVMMKVDLESEFEQDASVENGYYVLPDKHDQKWLNSARKASITHTRIRVLEDDSEQIQIRRWVVVPSSKLNLSVEEYEALKNELSQGTDEIAENGQLSQQEFEEHLQRRTPTQNQAIIFNTDESSDSDEYYMESEEDRNLWSSPVSSEEQEFKTEMTLADQYLQEALISLEKMMDFIEGISFEEQRNLRAEILSCRQRITRVQALFINSTSKVE